MRVTSLAAATILTSSLLAALPSQSQAQKALPSAGIPALSSCPASSSVEPWKDRQLPASCRAAYLIRAMSLEEKLAQLAESVDEKQKAKYGIPVLNASDGPNGLATPPMPGIHPPMSMQVTAFPNEITLAAAWNRELAASFGKALAEEWRGKGSNEIIGPTMNLMRTWHWGRSAETYGEDPYLTGELATAEIRAIQSGKVIAMAKHFTANNQDADRVGHYPDFTGVNEEIPQRALEEIYYAAWRTVVAEADPGASMCSYIQINGQFSCDNAAVQQKLREWGFRGFNIPDAVFALHDPLLAIKAGVDQLNMWVPNGTIALLHDLVAQKQLDESSVDVMLQHMLEPIFRLGTYDDPAPGNPMAHVATPAHAALSREVIAQGAVLLKNQDHLLPLAAGKLRRIAVIGPNMGAQTITGEFGPFVHVDQLSEPAAAIRALAGKTQVDVHELGAGTHQLPKIPAEVLVPDSGSGHGLTANYYKSSDLSGQPAATRVDASIDFDALPAHELGEQPFSMAAPTMSWSARWSGSLIPPSDGNYVFSLHGGGSAELLIDGKPVVTLHKVNFVSTSFGCIHLEAGKAVHVELRHSNDYEVLGSHLQLGWYPPQQQAMQAALDAATAADAVLVFAGEQLSEGMDKRTLHLPGDQDALIEAVAARNPHTIVVLSTSTPVAMPWLSKVAAALEAWYPGQEAGAGIAAVLFGDKEPGGRLPVTFPADESQGPATSARNYPGVDGTVHYDEGILTGYRWYDAKAQQPLFPFGFGLSYTSFAYSNLTVEKQSDALLVHLKVKNTGGRSGSDVVQLYVQEPAAAKEPPVLLRGFEKLTLASGEERSVTMRIPLKALQAWSDIEQKWQLVPGSYLLHAGASSRDLRLHAKIALP